MSLEPNRDYAGKTGQLSKLSPAIWYVTGYAAKLWKMMPRLYRSPLVISATLANGPHAGRKALTLYSLPTTEENPDIPVLARAAGFSLHAASVCEAHQRGRLERLCRCITRLPIATKRLSVDGQGGVVYRHKQLFRD